MKRVLVTGAEGFTGSLLVAHLARSGFEVHGIIHVSATFPENGPMASCHALDLCKAEALADAVRQVEPNAVIHLAGISSPAHGDVRQIYETNFFGSQNLLNALSALDCAPDAVILASSANVYQPGLAGQIREDAALGPINDYGVSKLAMEYLRGVFATRLPIIVTRPFNYTGLGQSTSFVIPKIVAALKGGASAVELGNIDVSRDWSDVRYVVDCYARLLATPKAIGGTFNICSGRAVSLRNIIDTACDIAGRKIDVGFNPQFARANEIPSLWGDNSRLLEAIGHAQPIAIEDTLRWMLEMP